MTQASVLLCESMNVGSMVACQNTRCKWWKIIYEVLLMDEILHHLGCIKPYKQWDIYQNLNWCRPDFWTINSINDGKWCIWSCKLVTSCFCGFLDTQNKFPGAHGKIVLRGTCLHLEMNRMKKNLIISNKIYYGMFSYIYDKHLPNVDK